MKGKRQWFFQREKERNEGTRWMRVRKRKMKGRSVDNIVGGGHARLVNNEASTLSHSSLFFLSLFLFFLFSLLFLSFLPSFFLSIFVLSANSSHYNKRFWMITSLTLSKFLPTFSHFLCTFPPLSLNQRYCSQLPTGLTSSWSLQRRPLT